MRRRPPRTRAALVRDLLIIGAVLPAIVWSAWSAPAPPRDDAAAAAPEDRQCP